MTGKTSQGSTEEMQDCMIKNTVANNVEEQQP
jgi:hypothetical protein